MNKRLDKQGFDPESDLDELRSSLRQRIGAVKQYLAQLEHALIALGGEPDEGIARSAFTGDLIVQFLERNGKGLPEPQLIAELKKCHGGPQDKNRQWSKAIRDNLLTKAEWKKEGRQGTAKERLKRFPDGKIGLPEWPNSSGKP